jgi:uncharacterized Zn finger protein
MGQLTDSDIQKVASSQSFERGYSYYRSGYVLEVVRRGKTITAEA